MDVYAVGVASGRVRRLTRHSAADLFPNWSPDGGELVFFSQRDGNDEIYLIDAQASRAGESVLRLTENEANDFVPTWSPAGSRIVFASNRIGPGRAQLFVMDAGGYSVDQVTAGTGRATEPTWSPDGGSIAFTTNRDGNDEIYAKILRCPS
jgi:Tol biopolymer transport system component